MIRVFNPFAVSNRRQSLTSVYRAHDNEKKIEYSERVREVEHASFIPLVLSATGRWAREASVFYKLLASLLADKWDQPYSSTMNWLRCSLSFFLWRIAIHCIRGSRSSKRHLAHNYGQQSTHWPDLLGNTQLYNLFVFNVLILNLCIHRVSLLPLHIFVFGFANDSSLPDW